MLKNKSSRTLGKKIGFGFGLLILIFIVSVGVTIFQMRKAKEVSNRIRDLRGPTAQASLRMLNGINHSLAALRGWMILGEEKFKEESSLAWSNEIGKSLEEIRSLSNNWTNPENVERFEKVEQRLAKFKKFEGDIEDIAWSNDNLPASKILLEEAAPRAKILFDSITEIIEVEKGMENSIERKRFLWIMADFRGSLGLSLAAVRAYLISGDNTFQKEFIEQWSVNSHSFLELNKVAGKLTKQQQHILNRINKIREEFNPLPPKMFKIRSNDEWNIANFLLKTKVTPLAFEIKDILKKMVRNQQELMEHDFVNNSKTISRLYTITWILLALGILSGIVVSVSIIRSATVPIRKAIETVDNIVVGNLKSTIKVTGFREIELLGNALTQMQTQLRKNADEVKESEVKNRIVVDTAADGIITITENGIVQTINQAGCKMFGYLKEEIVANNIKMLMPEPYMSNHDRYLNNYLTTGKSKIIGIGREVEGMRKDGTIFPIYLTIAEVKLKTGKLFAGIVRDITKTKQRENDLRKIATEKEQQLWMINAKNKLSDKMRGSADAKELSKNIACSLSELINADIGAVYVTQQDKNLKLLGSYAFKDRQNNFNEFQLGEGLVGQAALEKTSILFSKIPEDSAKINYGIGEVLPQQFLITPVVYDGDLKAVIALGTARNFSEHHRAFIDQSSTDIGIAFNLVQSQEQIKTLLYETRKQSDTLKESEEELRAQQEELQSTNAELEEKTEKLENQKQEVTTKNRELEKAAREIELKAKELEETSRYKSEFLANMSHELRTPLNSLLILAKGFANNEDGNLNPEQIEAANVIHSSGTDLLELINEILDLSKIEAGKMDLYIDKIRLEDIIKNIKRNFTHVANDKGIGFEVTIDDNLPKTFKSDAKKVDQILKNFLSNAFKFTKEGAVTVHISQAEKENNLSLAVYDTGIGIPTEKQGLVFDAFKQADGSTKRKFGGTGLGLSISKKFATLLGGEINLKSEKGKGSCFTLILPMELSETETEDATQEVLKFTSKFVPAIKDKNTMKNPEDYPLIEDDRKNLSHKDKTVLIIEDDPKFSKILLDTARNRKFKGLVAFDGESGIKTAQEFQPMSIILDIMLPEMNGWRVIDQLKNSARTRHIPVHFISALEEDIDAYKKGAVGYISKPVSKDDLYKVFESIENFIDENIRHILIAGRDKEERMSINEVIKGKEVEITEASDGKSAFIHLQSHPCDCIIACMNLSDMSIFEFLNKLREIENVDRLPIIIHIDKDISWEEETALREYAQNNVIKEVKSSQRLLDEVMLFLHKVEADLPEEQQKSIRMLHNTETILNGKRILVVDDDMRNTFSLSHVLEKKGVKVLVAENGELAIKSLNENPDIDLVLMDIMMPVMDGYQAIEEIRKQKRFAALPIIALTAKAMKGDKDKCIKAGANDYLSKPVDVERLFSMLRVWLYR